MLFLMVEFPQSSKLTVLLTAFVIITGESCVLLSSVQEFIEIKAWLLLNFFMFTQSIKFYKFYCHVLKSTGV